MHFMDLSLAASELSIFPPKLSCLSALCSADLSFSQIRGLKHPSLHVNVRLASFYNTRRT